MADFALLWERQSEVLGECRAQIAARDANQVGECAAVTSIQNNYRGMMCRDLYKRKRAGAVMMQRLFRGYTGRNCAAEALSEGVKRQEIAFFHYHVAVLQRSLRGFYSRKYVHDFYARKAYIQSVVEKSNMLRTQLAAQREASKREEQQRKLREAQKSFKEATQTLHHLVSTKSRLGVYRSPFSDDLQPTAFGVPIEEHLRRNTREILHTRGLKTARHVKRRTRGSVLAQDPYDEIQAVIRAETRHSKMRRVSRKDFVAGGRSRVLEQNRISSVHASAPYQEENKRRTKGSGGSRFKPFYTTVNAPDLFDEVADAVIERQIMEEPSVVFTESTTSGGC
jgi:hypothetical protein